MSDSRAERLSPLIRPSVFAAVVILSLGGCAVLSDPSVPGMGKKVLILDPPPVSTILMALKCQLANAFVKINKLKDGVYAQNPVAQTIKFNDGVGVFSGQTQIIHGNTGTVSAVIPFTGFVGSTLGPDLGANLKGTATETTTRTFTIEPKASSDAVCKVAKQYNVEVGDFVEKRLIAEYETSVALPLVEVDGKKEAEKKEPDDDKKADKVRCRGGDDEKLTADKDGDKICKYQKYEPLFTETELQFKTTFVVNVGVNGGVKSTVLLSNPRLTSFGPGATADYAKSRTYTLTVTFPMGTNENTENDPRRITYCDVSDISKLVNFIKDGNLSEDGLGRIKLLCVEEQYKEVRYNVLLDGLDSPRAYGNRTGAVQKALAFFRY